MAKYSNREYFERGGRIDRKDDFRHTPRWIKSNAHTGKAVASK